MMTSHELAKELLGKPNAYITASYDEKEFYIDTYKRVVTEDDDNRSLEWTLNLKEKKWR